MLFDWSVFVRLARELTDQANASEGHLRTAVSRAYFGAYGHACRYATDYLFFSARANVDDHGRLRAHLRGKRRAGDALRLDDLRQMRNLADYADELDPYPDFRVKAREAILLAEQIFASLIPPPKA